MESQKHLTELGQAKNDYTSEVVLEALSKGTSAEIRFYISIHPKANSQTLDFLSKDESGIIRRRVACHPNTTRETLNLLLTDSNKYVVEEVMLRLSKNLKSFI